MALHAAGAVRSLRALPQLIILSLLLRNGIISPARTPAAAIAINSLLKVEQLKYTHYMTCFIDWLQLDHDLHDIPLEEETSPRVEYPRQHIRFSRWSYKTCDDATGFVKDQLRRIYNQFGLRELAAENDGKISVLKGYDKVTGDPLYYNFDPEELFLFFMTKCRHGVTNKVLCKLVFGGDQTRWSYGFPWMLRYVNERYRDILGHQGLLRFVDDFPRFYEAFERAAVRDVPYHRRDGTGFIRTGLRFLPFDICALVDCSIFRASIPFSGPDGDYVGAPRKENAFYFNRAVYTKFNKVHGIKVETCFLPNGMSTLFGPVSTRQNDVGEGAVLEISGLDEFLLEIQRDKDHVYSAFGDSVYGMAGLHCVRSYYRSIGGSPLTEYQKVCNQRMKSIREKIEHGYGDVTNRFKLCADPENFRLGQRHPYAVEELRTCFLLTNMYVCMNGNSACSYQMFDCMPPSLEEYLRLEPRRRNFEFEYEVY